jgi:hypothetical protein
VAKAISGFDRSGVLCDLATEYTHEAQPDHPARSLWIFPARTAFPGSEIMTDNLKGLG